MNELPYSLIIEASETPGFLRFSSPDLKGFSGMGQSVEDCVRSAKLGMLEYINLLRSSGLPVPPPNPCSQVIA